MSEHPKPRSSTFLEHTFLSGTPFWSNKVASSRACQQLCIKNPDCGAWTYNTTNQECDLLKSTNPASFNSLFMVSGVVGTDAGIHGNQAPVTNNRFNNNTQPQTPTPNRIAPIAAATAIPIASTHAPFFASGTPVSANTNVGKISTDNTTPYNGELIKPTQAQPNRVYSSIDNVILPRSQKGHPVYAKTAADCKNACINDPTCSQYSYNPAAYGPACLIVQAGPEMVYSVPGAQVGQAYDLHYFTKDLKEDNQPVVY